MSQVVEGLHLQYSRGMTKPINFTIVLYLLFYGVVNSTHGNHLVAGLINVEIWYPHHCYRWAVGGSGGGGRDSRCRRLEALSTIYIPKTVGDT